MQRTVQLQYNETDAQQIVDNESGLFLCRECVRTYTNHPNPPNKKEYTLKLVDNQKELKNAMDNMRRVKVQLSSKVDICHPNHYDRGYLICYKRSVLRKVVSMTNQSLVIYQVRTYQWGLVPRGLLERDVPQAYY